MHMTDSARGPSLPYLFLLLRPVNHGLDIVVIWNTRWESREWLVEFVYARARLGIAANRDTLASNSINLALVLYPFLSSRLLFLSFSLSLSLSSGDCSAIDNSGQNSGNNGRNAIKSFKWNVAVSEHEEFLAS